MPTTSAVPVRGRVLIVEDEAVVAEDLAAAIGALGYDVVGPVADGQSAVEAAASSRIDVVLMDIRLSGSLDGIEAARIIREEAGAPAIYLTAHADEAIMSRAAQTEPYAYLLKPYREPELRSVVEGAIRCHGKQSRHAPARRPWGKHALEIGGRYVIERPLGHGGMGRVYVAQHVHLGRRFALKIMHPALANDTRCRELFIREARLASEISHPNVVSVVDFGEDPNVGAYMVMDLLDGENLAEAKGPISVRRACDVLAQVADALDAIHQRGIVHGDIKPDNVMLVEEPGGLRRRRIARVFDFGLASEASTAAEDPHVAGTPAYLAPERARGGPATVATDLYALGILGYYLLTGSEPFTGTDSEIFAAHALLEPAAMGPRRGEPIDPALEALIRRAIAKRPVERHPSVAAFRYELHAVMDMLNVGPRRVRTRS